MPPSSPLSVTESLTARHILCHSESVKRQTSDECKHPDRPGRCLGFSSRNIIHLFESSLVVRPKADKLFEQFVIIFLLTSSTLLLF